jgi:hypothetical protein
MKFKVIYDFNNASGTGDSVVSSFYTLAEANASANDWVGLSGSFRAYVWDGTRWNQID